MSHHPSLIESGFFYLRHGQSESNVRGLIGGATDYALTDQGRDEARAAGERLRGQDISAIYASPLQRAYDTACIVAEALGGVSVEAHEDLRERTFGVWEGQPISEFVRGVTPEGGEPIESFRSRIIGSLDVIAAPPTVLPKGLRAQLHLGAVGCPRRPRDEWPHVDGVDGRQACNRQSSHDDT